MDKTITRVLEINEQNYKMILDEDFEICSADSFKDAEYLPNYCGRLQTMHLLKEDDKTCLYMQTEENPPCKRHGIILAEQIKVDGEMSIEILVKPIGDLDGIAELWLTNADGSKGVSLELFGGCFGCEKETIAEFDNKMIYAPNNLWDWHKWYYLYIQLKSDKTVMALLNEDRMILWKHCFSRPITDLFDTFNIALAQELDTPGPGTYYMKSYVDYIKVGKQINETTQDLDKLISKQDYVKMQVAEKVKMLSYKDDHIQALGEMHPFIDMQNTFTNNELVIKCDGDSTSMQTKEKYSLPIKVNLTAKTDSTNIRMYYKKGEVIFNWECNENELRVHDVINGTNYGYSDKGKIPVDEYIDIEWIIHKDFMAIYVNGELRHAADDYPYITMLKDSQQTEISDYVRVSSAWGSTITVKSLKVTEIK